MGFYVPSNRLYTKTGNLSPKDRTTAVAPTSKFVCSCRGRHMQDRNIVWGDVTRRMLPSRISIGVHAPVEKNGKCYICTVGATIFLKLDLTPLKRAAAEGTRPPSTPQPLKPPSIAVGYRFCTEAIIPYNDTQQDNTHPWTKFRIIFFFETQEGGGTNNENG